MTTFVDLYFPVGIEIDRDEIEVAIERELVDTVAVVGAGVGTGGTNIDLELRNGTVDQALQRLAATLRRLGVPASTKIVVSDPSATLTLGDVPQSLGE